MRALRPLENYNRFSKRLSERTNQTKQHINQSINQIFFVPCICSHPGLAYDSNGIRQETKLEFIKQSGNTCKFFNYCHLGMGLDVANIAINFPVSPFQFLRRFSCCKRHKNWSGETGNEASQGHYLQLNFSSTTSSMLI